MAHDEFDIAGDDDIGYEVGYEVGYEEIGRKRGRPVVRKVAVPAGMARQAQFRGPTLAVGPYGTPVHAAEPKAAKALYQVFGLGTATTVAAGNADLSQTFQEAFRPERLVLVESVPGNTTISAIIIGVRPQQANIAQMPASAFGPGAFETRVQFDTGQPGQVFLIPAYNAAAGTFSGMAFGTVIKSA